jgi:hypothetical protein
MAPVNAPLMLMSTPPGTGSTGPAQPDVSVAEFSMPKTVTVSTAKQLVAAAKSAVAGDTILMTAGFYGFVSFNKINPTGTVTIKSASGQNDVEFNVLAVASSSNLSIQNVNVVHPMAAGDKEWTRSASIGGSHDISLVGINFMGSMDGNRNNDCNGLMINGCSRITVLDSTFQQFNNAVVIGSTNDIIFAGNTIKEVREGVNMSGIKGGLFERNYISDVAPDFSKGDHSDAFQLHAGGNATVSSDIVFRSNVIVTPSAQGIFINSAKTAQGLFQNNIVIENNYYEGNQRNAISVNGSTNVIVTRNSLRDAEGSGLTPAVVVGSSGNVAVTKNIAPIFVTRDTVSANITYADNIDTYDRTQRKGVAVASVFTAPVASGNIDFSALNPVSTPAANTAATGFHAVAGIGNLSGPTAAMLASYVPQFEGLFSASYFG